jgi:ribonuclease HII
MTATGKYAGNTPAVNEYMARLDEELPGYGFAKHKGYPTKQHYEAIRLLGPSIEHRLSFRGVLVK